MSVIADCRIVTPVGVIEAGWLRVEGDRIAGFGSGRCPVRPDHDLGGLTVVPGFVDQHCHGGGGHSFVTRDAAEARRAARYHLEHGTTSVAASLVSEGMDELTHQIGILTRLVEEDAIFGIHLEGPWLSGEYAGAHDLVSSGAPGKLDWNGLLEVGAGCIAMVTIAPELPGALTAIELIVASGAIAAVGHTNADYDRARAAIDAGVRVGTHVFNAMRPIHHRDPGAVVALLEDPRVTVELICDGCHVHPAVLRLLFAGPACDRIAVVSDATAAAGAADGRYRLGEVEIEVVGGVARVAGTEVIAGGTHTLDAALRYLVDQVGIDLARAVRAVSTIPAAAMGLTDRGSIVVGKRADLVVLDPELRVYRVMRSGGWIELGEA